MPDAHRSARLPMPATDLTTLIANGQAVAPLETPAAQDCATIFGCHTRQKSVLTATRNTFGLPCSLGHWRQPHNIIQAGLSWRSRTVPPSAFRLATEAAAMGCNARLCGPAVPLLTAIRGSSVSISFTTPQTLECGATFDRRGNAAPVRELYPL